MHLGGTRTHDALNFARRELFSGVNGARPNSAKIVFVITDGKSYEPSLTAAEAELVSITFFSYTELPSNQLMN